MALEMLNSMAWVVTEIHIAYEEKVSDNVATTNAKRYSHGALLIEIEPDQKLF